MGGGASAWVPEGIVVGSQLGRERGTGGSCQRGKRGAGEEREHGLWALTPARSAGTTAAARDGLKGPSLEGGLPRAPAADPELQVPCAPSPGGAAAGCPHRQAQRCPRLRWGCCGDCMGLAWGWLGPRSPAVPGLLDLPAPRRHCPLFSLSFLSHFPSFLSLSLSVAYFSFTFYSFCLHTYAQFCNAPPILCLPPALLIPKPLPAASRGRRLDNNSNNSNNHSNNNKVIVLGRDPC